jgi:putative restriction endonuclease
LSVGYLILEMREGSGWGDSESHYEFPVRYLARFEEALSDGEAVALIYEPRREGGRMAFVAWTRIVEAPTRSADGRNWVVRFEGGLRSFDRIVPLQINGIPVEHSLREVPVERRGVALQGRAVRNLSADNALEILALGSAAQLIEPLGPVGEHVAESLERGRRLVARLDRDARFRDEVLHAYGFRCALSGLGLGPRPASRLAGVIDAAHIRPASHSGPDHVRNGLALTPSVHRKFDAGLFALRERRGEWCVELSSQLDAALLVSDRGARIPLADGVRLALPRDAARTPLAEHFDYHRRNVFVA